MTELSVDICSALCDPNGVVCNSLCMGAHNCPISSNALFNFARVAAQYRFFTQNVGTTIEDKAGFLAARLGLYQQIPWLVGFIFLIIFLIYSYDIAISTGIVLIIIALIVVGFFLVVSFFDTRRSIQEITTAVEQQFINNFNSLKGQFALDAFNAVVPFICSTSSVGCNSLCTST